MLDRERAIEAARAAIRHGCGRCGRMVAPCSDCAGMGRFSRFPPIDERVADAILALPVDITDEMVDLVLEPLHARFALVGQDYADVRAALEAALNPQQ